MGKNANRLPGYQARTYLGDDIKRRRGLTGCPIVNSPAAVHAVFKGILRFPREMMISGALDCRNRLLCWSIISVGTNHKLMIRLCDAFTDAVRVGASGIILVHNHPSGALDPSKEDLIVTRKILRIGKFMGYPLLDHVIVSPEGYKSIIPCLKAETAIETAEQFGKAADVTLKDNSRSTTIE